MRWVASVVMGMALILAMGTFASGSEILAPGDPILAINIDALFSNSSYPAGEPPAAVLDDDANTKYLNFGGRNSGFIVSPAFGHSQVQSFVITTANDAEGRDPTSWELWGTNETIVSLDNSDGMGENWTLVDSGSVSLPDTRFTVGPVVTVNNAGSYASYRFTFPSLKCERLMQIADVAFYESTDGSGNSVLATGDPILAIQLPRTPSDYPCGEAPTFALDGDPNTKYLNFGKENTGFIVTPSAADVVRSFQITTANDSPSRDPSSWELYGTNDPIVSTDNSQGDGENWTLIGSGTVELPTDRMTAGARVAVNNDTAYSSFRMIFPTQRDPNAGDADSLQFADIQFYNVVPEPATFGLAITALFASLTSRRRYQYLSST